ncbi:HTH-type transcriptional regulator CynR [Pseudovibrio axinellae]|uniref:HTH-type transcriptional regulator CynR n=1 Tax=Pseudovibrio axinellae TaxID=989403 RepID=A0A165YYV8_9HYPH|nr:LysR family transcriptional regulator [Pseudovibrio axinellae]KZL19359.1 HTH-type transcriptional regulator CynR [Pseudovibrio axinellae]SEQ39805.1 DNA-binding transcriptional regulator, LysR family [Pseudovibrio axinellae]
MTSSRQTQRTATHLPELAVRALPLLQKVGSVTKTAHQLGVSQSAVSQSIAELEKRVGVQVLRRGTQPVQLTQEGQVLVEYALNMQAAEKNAMAQINDLRHNKSGCVKIGSSGPSASTRLLPDLMQRVSRQYPGIALELREAQDQETIAALRRSEIDLAVITDIGDGDEFETIPLACDQLVGIVAQGAVTSSSISAAGFQQKPFIMTKGGSEPLVRKWFSKADSEPRVDHSIQQITSILAIVRAGLAYSIIAELALPEKTEGIDVLPLAPAAPRNLYLARLPITPSNSAARKVWELAEILFYAEAGRS